MRRTLQGTSQCSCLESLLPVSPGSEEKTRIAQKEACPPGLVTIIMGTQLQAVPEGNPALELKQLRGASPPRICVLEPQGAECYFASVWPEDRTNMEGRT